MRGMPDPSDSVGSRLNELLAEARQPALSDEQTMAFEAYLALLLRWNARMNLTAIRDEGGILARHFVESIACARAIPPGVGTLLDFGSGAGFPGIPIAICRPEIAVTLAESQGKKAAFLREAVRSLGLKARVHSGRAELLAMQFDCVLLRSVDRMEAAVRAAAGLVAPSGWLAPMTTRGELDSVKAAARGEGWIWQDPVSLPRGRDRVLVLGKRTK